MMNQLTKRNTSRRASENTLAIILAGGSGTRLKSLTQWHSKPAIPFGGKFRTIDFPLSNCINSDIRKISILTQYKSHSLNAHIQKGWSFLRPELGEFIDCIPAQQRIKDSWYQGTADAVYQNLDIIREQKPNYVVVLAGDHVYKMDYREMILDHINNNADMTVACLEVPKAEATQFGVMTIDQNNLITRFTEKPANPETVPGNPAVSMASMGIYVFSTEFLYEKLVADAKDEFSSHDFGKDIIPASMGKARISAFPFKDSRTGKKGYWRDVGTIDSYYEANMDLVKVSPQLNLYDDNWPVWTYQEQLPPAKFIFNYDNRRGMAVDSMVSGGCIISGALVERSLLSNKVRINSYSRVSDSIILPDVEIGRNCIIQNCIIDQGCHIPSGTSIGVNLIQDAERFHVSSGGVVLVSKQMLGQEYCDVA
jgi:glucose-1-phosphate adenylyltransferase